MAAEALGHLPPCSKKHGFFGPILQQASGDCPHSTTDSMSSSLSGGSLESPKEAIAVWLAEFLCATPTCVQSAI